MDPILEEVYSIIVPSAPYVIGAYALIWVVLLVFVIVLNLLVSFVQYLYNKKEKI